jgi:uncharacterized membrane protein YqjE
MAHNRFRLFTIELREEKIRVFRLLFASVAGALFFVLAVLTAMGAIVLGVDPADRAMALWICAGVLALLWLLCVLLVVWVLKRPLFPATLAEFERDEEEL